MSVLVGWHHFGLVAVLDGATGSRKVHNVKQVEKNVESFTTSLKLLKKVLDGAPGDVKRLVFVHDGFNGVLRREFAQCAQKEGFPRVSLVNWINNDIQMFLRRREELPPLPEGLHILCVTKSIVHVRRVCGRQLDFVHMISWTTNDALQRLVTAIRVHKVRLCIAYHSIGRNQELTVLEVLAQYFPQIVVLELDFKREELAETALTRAQIIEDPTYGVLVQNHNWCGPRLCVGDRVLLDRTRVRIPLPLQWSSEWLQSTSANEPVKLEFDGTQLEEVAPSGIRHRVQVEINESGIAELKVTQPVGICLASDSIRIVQYPCNVVASFSTDVEYASTLARLIPKNQEQEEVEQTNIVKDAIDMLVPNSTLKPGWMCILNATTKENCVLLGSDRTLKSAYEVVKDLLAEIQQWMKDSNLPLDDCRILTTDSISPAQRDRLCSAARGVGFSTKFSPLPMAIATGFATRNDLAVHERLVLIESNMSGTTLTLLQCTELGVKKLSRWRDKNLNVELLRQGQRKWLHRVMQNCYPSVETPADEENVMLLQNTSYNVTELPEAALVQLSDGIQTLLKCGGGTEETFPSRVKAFVLLGECRLLPLLNNLLRWKFDCAIVCTPVGTDLDEMMLIGACCLRTPKETKK